MTTRFKRQCPCCGTVFNVHHLARVWCSPKCRRRAYERRRRGYPESDYAFNLMLSGRQQALQPALVAADDADTLPALWASPERVHGTEQRFWHGVPISRRESDGFVNATQMAKANGKHLPHYMANDRTTAYIAALAPVVGIPTTDLLRTIQGGTPELQGTWIHPRLAVDLARWISPAFAVWMDGWFLESLTRPQQPAYSGTGVYVVAPTQREACTIWRDAVQDAVNSAIAGRFSPDHRTDCGLKTLTTTAYSWVSSR